MVAVMKAKDARAGMTGVKMMISGASGSGKTTLGAKASDNLVILTEIQGLTIVKAWNPDASVVLIETADDIRSILRDLRSAEVVDSPDGKGPAIKLQNDVYIRTVVLDSVTDLQRLLKTELLALPTEGARGRAQSGSGSSQREVLTMQEWGILIDRTERLLRAFRDLPCNLLALFLAEEKDDGDRVVVRPQVYGKKLPSTIQQFFIGAGFLFRKNESTETGKGVVRRAVLFDGDDRYLVKPFPGCPNITIPDFDHMVELLSDFDPNVSIEENTEEEHVEDIEPDNPVEKKRGRRRSRPSNEEATA